MEILTKEIEDIKAELGEKLADDKYGVIVTFITKKDTESALFNVNNEYIVYAIGNLYDLLCKNVGGLAKDIVQSIIGDDMEDDGNVN